MSKIVIDPEFQSLISTLNDTEYAELEKSILAEGCRDALVLWGDILLDGHNRYEICTEHGIEFRTVQREFETREAAKDWMIRNQLGRRNLTLEQRNYFIGKLYQEQKQAHGGDRKSSHQNDDLKKTSEKIAEEHKVSKMTVERAEKFTEAVDTIAANTDPEARKKILNRNIHTTAKEVSALAKQPADFQKRVISSVLSGKTESVKKAISQVVKQEQRNQTIPSLPAGKYRCLVIDPPWPMQKIQREVRPNQITMDYAMMEIEEISDLDIPSLAYDEGCHLYLWTTHKYLPSALEIIKAWGFRYQCLLTWVKNVGITPFSWMYSTELVVFGRKGNLDLLRNGLRIDFQAKVREHSRKPDEFYELVKRASPEPRIDMFSREKRDGFDQWGSEVDYFAVD